MCIDIDAENLALMLSYRVTRRDNRARRRVRIRCRPAAKLQLSELREHGRPPLSPPHPGNRACRQSHAQISESPAGPDAACSLQYARLTSTPRKLAPTRQRQAPPTSAAPPTPPHPQSPPPKGQPKKAGAGFLRSSHPSTPPSNMAVRGAGCGYRIEPANRSNEQTTPALQGGGISPEMVHNCIRGSVGQPGARMAS